MNTLMIILFGVLYLIFVSLHYKAIRKEREKTAEMYQRLVKAEETEHKLIYNPPYRITIRALLLNNKLRFFIRSTGALSLDTDRISPVESFEEAVSIAKDVIFNRIMITEASDVCTLVVKDETI